MRIRYLIKDILDLRNKDWEDEKKKKKQAEQQKYAIIFYFFYIFITLSQ
jgi:hypothetical protein